MRLPPQKLYPQGFAGAPHVLGGGGGGGTGMGDAAAGEAAWLAAGDGEGDGLGDGAGFCEGVGWVLATGD